MTPSGRTLRGTPDTTGAHEVMTVYKLQHCLDEDSPGEGTLTSKGPYEYCATVRYQSSRVHRQWSVQNRHGVLSNLPVGN